MNVVIFDQLGAIRRKKVQSVGGGIYHVSDTEGFFVELGREAIEIRPPLMGFNPFGLFPLKKGRLLVAAANEAEPLLLQAGRANRYRAAERTSRKKLADRMKDVEREAVLVAGQRAERKILETKGERIVGIVIYSLLAVFVIELFLLMAPKLSDTWGKLFG